MWYLCIKIVRYSLTRTLMPTTHLYSKTPYFNLFQCSKTAFFVFSRQNLFHNHLSPIAIFTNLVILVVSEGDVTLSRHISLPTSLHLLAPKNIIFVKHSWNFGRMSSGNFFSPEYFGSALEVLLCQLDWSERDLTFQFWQTCSRPYFASLMFGIWKMNKKW